MIYSIDFGVSGGVQSYSLGLVDLLNENETHVARAIALVNTSENCFKILHHHDATKAAKLRLTAKAVRSELRLCKDDTLILHDASTMDFFRKITLKCRVWIVLHGDYQYYYDTAKKFGLWADEIFAVNQHLKTTVERNFRHRVQCHYLPAAAPKWSAPELSEKKEKIIFVGRKTKQKGAHLIPLIDAFLQKKGLSCEWSIVTSGDKLDNDVEADLMEWQETESSNRIAFHQNIGRDAIRNEYSESSIFILPSQAEGFPVSLIEAMNQGCVPIIFNYGPDAVNQMPLSLSEFVCNDWQEMAERIYQLCSSGVVQEQEIALAHCQEFHGRAQTLMVLKSVQNGSGPKWKNPRIFFLKRLLRFTFYRND